MARRGGWRRRGRKGRFRCSDSRDKRITKADKLAPGQRARGRDAALIELPGGRRLFRYETDGSLCNLTGARLNSYVAEYVGDEFTAKDFRSRGGSLLAGMALAEHRPSEDETDAKRVVTGVMRVSPRTRKRACSLEQNTRRFQTSPFAVVGARDTTLDREERALLSSLLSWRIRPAHPVA